MKDLKEIRAEIDSVDKELVSLYEKRMSLTEQVADYKLSTGKKVFDKAREEEKLEKVTSMVDDPFLKRGTRELFEHLMSMSRKRQYQKLAEKGIMEPIPFEEVAALPDKNIRIVYQGEEGAYSQMAMKQFFHDTTNSYHVQWKPGGMPWKQSQKEKQIMQCFRLKILLPELCQKIMICW